MRKLDLDLVRPPAPPRWAGWLMLAVALAFAADLAFSYRALQAQLELKRDRMTRIGARPATPGLMTVAARPPDPEEIAFARDTIRRLALPWDVLFEAIEFAQSDKIAILSIEPDAEKSTVTITGEAKDYLAMLSYVATLSSHKALTRVQLARHEARPNDPRRPLVFTLTAGWSGAR